MLILFIENSLIREKDASQVWVWLKWLIKILSIKNGVSARLSVCIVYKISPTIINLKA